MKKIEKRGFNNFVIGAGSILNIYPTASRSIGQKGTYRDFQGLKSDWNAIGKDFDLAFKKLMK